MAIWGGRIYFGYLLQDGIHIHALNLSDGSTAWERVFSSPQFDFTNRTLTISNGVLFTFYRDPLNRPFLLALNATSGQNVRPPYAFPPLLGFGDLVASGSRVFAAVYPSHSQVQIYAFDVQTGARLWVSSLLDNASLLAASDSTVYALGNGILPTMYALDAQTGNFRWPPIATGFSRTYGHILLNTLIYAICQTPSTLHVCAYDTANGNRVWLSEDYLAAYGINMTEVIAANGLLFALGNPSSQGFGSILALGR